MKRYSESERQAMMAEQEASGTSLREFCEAKGLNLRTFQRWKTEAKRMGETRLDTQTSSFLPVQVGMKKRALGQSEERFLTLGDSGVAQRLPMPRLIIQIGKGWVLEWQGPIEGGALEAALRVVVSVCGQN